MEKIYRVRDTHTGMEEWCMKAALSDTINSIQGSLMVKRMAELSLNPKMTTNDSNGLIEFIKDSTEIEILENEAELIELLNG